MNIANLVIALGLILLLVGLLGFAATTTLGLILLVIGVVLYFIPFGNSRR